ncbi:MAG: hypothetical protein HYU69_14685 [Bacteroidetes bacterium]|nr:hypothetical protein [Bacteroidota bacterium]
MNFKIKHLFGQSFFFANLIIIGCGSPIRKEDLDFKKDQIENLRSYLNKVGVENSTSNFLQFLYSHEKDTIILLDFAANLNFDSLILIPGNLQKDLIESKTGLKKLPVFYSPEDMSLILFKQKSKYTSYVYCDDDSLEFNVPFAKLEFAKTDTSLLVIRKGVKKTWFELKAEDLIQ